MELSSQPPSILVTGLVMAATCENIFEVYIFMSMEETFESEYLLWNFISAGQEVRPIELFK